MTLEERIELRNKFAAAALTGLLAGPRPIYQETSQNAIEAFKIADAMLAEAEKFQS